MKPYEITPAGTLSLAVPDDGVATTVMISELSCDDDVEVVSIPRRA
jgi:hypothetical protein